MYPSNPGSEPIEQHEQEPRAPRGLEADKELQDRLLRHGIDTLSDAEVLGLIVKSPDPYQSSAEFARDIMALKDGTLLGLGRLTIDELKNIKGYGFTRARTLIAAIELGKRRMVMPAVERHTVATSATAYQLLRPHLMDLPHEEFWILHLDRGNRLIRMERMSIGGLHGTMADPKVLFKRALAVGASSLVVAHNHPSGQLRPSEEDIRLTRKLTEGARLLDLSIHDHVIVTTDGYYSFADNGML